MVEDIRYHNLIEPEGLVSSFLAYPPLDFCPFILPGGVPVFSTRFDLLTTMERTDRRRIESLPFYGWWKRFLRWRACFAGTTVSEFALLPETLSPDALVRGLLNEANDHDILIIKDLPVDPVLVGEAACAHSRRVADACREAGFVLLEGQALAYLPIDFASMEEFLAGMPRSRRKDLKRKLRVMPRIAIECVHTGDPFFRVPAVLACLYELYLNVYRQSDIHFDQLTQSFFAAVLQNPANRGVVFVYRAQGEIVGFNLCFVEKEMLLDKYIGFAYPQARALNLYMVSWFHNVDYALRKGLRFYVSGWTDPEIKRHLGARFTMTRHAVYPTHRAARALLRPIKRFFEADREWHQARAAGADS